MRSLLLAVLLGLVGAALLHILIILALPGWTGKDAWTRVNALGEANRFFVLGDRPVEDSFFNEDPRIRAAVCRFDLVDGPIRVEASGSVPYWSAAAFDTADNETFSINDRSSIGEDVDITFVTPAQMLQLRRNMPDILARSVIVELSQPEGYVVLRAISPAPSFDATVGRFLDEAACAPFEGG